MQHIRDRKLILILNWAEKMSNSCVRVEEALSVIAQKCRISRFLTTYIDNNEKVLQILNVFKKLNVVAKTYDKDNKRRVAKIHQLANYLST